MASEAGRANGHTPRKRKQKEINSPLNGSTHSLEPGKAEDETLSSIYLGPKTRNRRRDLIKNLHDVRNRVVGQRILVREHRTALRNNRNTRNDLEAWVEQQTRNLIFRPAQADSAALARDIEALVEARERLRLSEDDYNRLEDTLNSSEWEMMRLERKVFRFTDDTDIQSEVPDESDDDMVYVPSTTSDDSASPFPKIGC